MAGLNNPISAIKCPFLYTFRKRVTFFAVFTNTRVVSIVVRAKELVGIVAFKFLLSRKIPLTFSGHGCDAI